MKFYTPFVIMLSVLSVLIFLFNSCLTPVKPDFTPRIEYDGNIKTDKSPEPGTKFTMYIVAVCENPLGYQWYKDNHPVEGAVADSFVINSLTVKHEGIYKCEVRSKSSLIYSKPYRLRLKENEQEPLLYDRGAIFSSGNSQLNRPFFLYIKPNRDFPLTYQWYKNDTIINQGTGDTLYFKALSNNNIGNYFCEVEYNDRTVRSLYYKIEIENKPPEFRDSLLHDSYQIDEGDTLTIRFEAIDENNDGIVYKLTKNTLPKPETAVFDTASKTMSWISRQGDKGIYKIVIEASDGKTVTEKVIEIGIGKINLNPRISIININRDDTVSISENDTLQFTVKISDPNTEDKPVFNEPENIPEGSIFDKSTGKFTYTPKYDVASDISNKIFPAITFHATDNAAKNPLQTKFIFHLLVRDKKLIITAESDTGGGIDPSGTIKAEPGRDYTFIITPDKGWAIKGILVNGIEKGAINSYIFKNIQQDNTIKVLFEKIIYTLTISSDDNGKADPEGKIHVDPDSSIKLTVNPKPGYKFNKWEILEGNPEIKKLSSNTFEVRLTNESTAIKALFFEKISVKYTASGSRHTLFLKSDNTLWATGYNKYGQLGDGTTINRESPVQVFTDVDSIISGYNSTFVIRKDKTLWVTGENRDGHFGLGDTLNRASFTQIPDINNIKGISVGFDHTMIIKANGALWGAGSNTLNCLGIEDKNQKRLRFTKIPDMMNVVKVSAGTFMTIVLLSDNTIWAVGGNSFGALGLGDDTTRSRFTKMPGMSNVTDITAEGYSTYFLKNDNSFWATGDNRNGQSGDGTLIERNSPEKIIDNVIAISPTFYNVLILKSDNTVWITGKNKYGVFGNNSNKNTTTPVKILENVKYISAGSRSSVIIKNDNTVWVTGWNIFGQLGLGDKTNRYAFTEILF